MFENYPDIVSVDHVSNMLNIGKSAVYSMLKNNELRHVKIGRKYIIPKSSVLFLVGDVCYTDKQVISSGLHSVSKGDNVL